MIDSNTVLKIENLGKYVIIEVMAIAQINTTARSISLLSAKPHGPCKCHRAKVIKSFASISITAVERGFALIRFIDCLPPPSPNPHPTFFFFPMRRHQIAFHSLKHSIINHLVQSLQHSSTQHCLTSLIQLSRLKSAGQSFCLLTQHYSPKQYSPNFRQFHTLS